ncbi:MAG: InlB B-repeat-containing protein, partial [Butyrivibrio sp.]|nr:InlB B-repeat-containing protein [Butyrivibrio sp.]
AGYSIANYWYYYSPSTNSGLGYVGGHADYTKYTDDYPVANDRFKMIRVGVTEESAKTYANVYYLQPLNQKHYFLKLVYQQYVDGTAVSGYSPLTTTIDGTEYQVCVANKADVFNGDKLIDGFEAVEVTYDYSLDPDAAKYEAGTYSKTGTFYTIKDDTHSPKLLFTVVDDDRFYIGNLASYTYNSAVEAHVGRENFDSSANTPAASYGTPEKINHGSERLESSGTEKPISGINGSTEDSAFTHLCYYFKFTQDFNIYYVYDGKTDKVEYGTITTVSKDDIGKRKDGTNVFEPGDGYEIVWYTDSNFTTLADSDIYVDQGIYLYGKRFNAPIENFDVAYYQLPNESTYYTGSLDDLYQESENVSIQYAYDTNTVVTKTGTYTKYYKSESDKVLYASKKSHFVTAFSELSMPYSDYIIDGYEHDSKNTSNVLSGFCGSSGINLRSYYARTSALLTIRRNDSDTTSNDETLTKVNGTTITVSDPSKTGYTFAGWKLYDYTNNTVGDELTASDYNYSHTDATENSSGYVTFDMPICPTLLEAQWTPAVIDFEIVHLYQDNNKKYQQTLLESYLDSPTSVENVITAVDENNENITYYYTGTDEEDKVASNLFAAVEKFAGDTEVTSETVINVDDHQIIVSGSMVSFASGTYTHNADDSGQLAEGGTFKAYYDAEVTFYYERDSSIEIKTRAYALDGGSSTGVTLSGSGNYYYGQQVSLYATMQPTGYTFRGWYKINSGNALTSDEIEDLENLIANAGTTDAVLTKAEESDTYTFSATESAYYIAVTEATGASKPDITITISRNLDYDPLYYMYKASDKNQFNASVNWGDNTDSSANNIKEYKWYYYSPLNMTEEEYDALDPENISLDVMTPLDDSNTSTFNLPTGYDAGYYVLRCVARIERQDNGRTETAYGSYKFRVLPNKDYLETTPVENQSYTGDTYKYTEKWLYTPD